MVLSILLIEIENIILWNKICHLLLSLHSSLYKKWIYLPKKVDPIYIWSPMHLYSANRVAGNIRAPVHLYSANRVAGNIWSYCEILSYSTTKIIILFFAQLCQDFSYNNLLYFMPIFDKLCMFLWILWNKFTIYNSYFIFT